MTDSYIVNRSWVEVDLDAVRHNVQVIRGQLWKTTELMAVVKADAYGHGVRHLVPELLAAGADRLAVSMLDEAIELRESGIRAPILILSYTDPRRAEEILQYQLTQTVFSWDLINALEQAGRRRGELAQVHVKIDTGMGRIGFVNGFDTIKTVERISELPHIAIEGIFTHFATAAEDTDYTRLQFNRFLSLCQEMERMGIYVPIKHCCNSAATLRFPEMQLDMVRPGLVLYGLLPDHCSSFAGELRPAMSIKSNVLMVKTLQTGHSVSYGRQFTTERETRVATIPIGYADGYPRKMTGKAHALIRGHRVPVIGAICMDACMLDVTEVPEEVLVGDEVVLCGSQADESGEVSAITMEELAGWADTITYEICSVIGKRVPRVYLREGQIESVYTDII